MLGIGGGVATCALLIAKQSGARVLVTSGSDEKLARARELGADGGFNYKTADWVKQVREATEGQGPDLIIDGTGGETFDKALDAVRPGGRVVTYGATTGQVPELTVRRIFWKQLNVLGSTMGAPDDFRSILALVTRRSSSPSSTACSPWTRRSRRSSAWRRGRSSERSCWRSRSRPRPAPRDRDEFESMRLFPPANFRGQMKSVRERCRSRRTHRARYLWKSARSIEGRTSRS